AEVHTENRFAEAVAWCTTNRRKPVAALANFNGRTADDTPPSGAHERSSSDTRPTNTRGKFLLNICEDSRMEILNGTLFERDSPGAFTSFQPNGEAVVDYALFSREFLSMLKPGALQVIRTDRDTWSDHAFLALHLSFP
ncbi:hypothetical protein B0H13DRAFT_1547651, partial [Mycena leptocephala]